MKTYFFVCWCVIFVGFVCLFDGSLADSSWNVDQNRLEVERSNQRLRSRSTQPHHYLSHKSLHGQRRHRNPERFDEISYSHHSPQIVTAPMLRIVSERRGSKIYKPLEDPSYFYRNKVFKNMTDDEKKSRSGIPYHSYDVNTFHDYDPKRTDKLTTRIRGHAVNVRPKAAMVREHGAENPNYDLPYSDSAVSRSGGAVRSNCVRCPAERTVIAAKGLDKVVLTQPQLQGCGNSPPPSDARFNIRYGVKVGQLLGEGSYLSIGDIILQDKIVQLCQYRHNVVVRKCPELSLPEGVEVECKKGTIWGAECNFSCSNSKHYLKGKKTIYCKDGIAWSGQPPKCKEIKGNKWCSLKNILRNGKVTCDTPDFDESIPAHGVPEGSACSVSCYSGSGTDAPKNIVCKAGKWQGRPVCKKSRRRHKFSTRHSNQKLLSTL